MGIYIPNRISLNLNHSCKKKKNDRKRTKNCTPTNLSRYIKSSSLIVQCKCGFKNYLQQLTKFSKCLPHSHILFCTGDWNRRYIYKLLYNITREYSPPAFQGPIPLSFYTLGKIYKLRQLTCWVPYFTIVLFILCTITPMEMVSRGPFIMTSWNFSNFRAPFLFSSCYYPF